MKPELKDPHQRGIAVWHFALFWIIFLPCQINSKYGKKGSENCTVRGTETEETDIKVLLLFPIYSL